jgi:hypothetical protein
MDSNLFARIQQAGRNTVRRTDWDRIPPNRRIENFLTEAMALATAADPEPMIEALVQARAITLEPSIERVDVATQQRVYRPNRQPTAKRQTVAIDLVLSLVRSDQSRDEMWLEVKAGAGLHGTQVEDYLHAIKRAKDQTSRKLVLLDYAAVAQKSAADHDGVIPMSWKHLYDAAMGSRSRVWRDFAGFLPRGFVATTAAKSALDSVDVAAMAKVLSAALGRSSDLPAGPTGWAIWTKGS